MCSRGVKGTFIALRHGMSLRTIIAVKSTALLIGCGVAEFEPRRVEAASALQSRSEALRRAQVLDPPHGPARRDTRHVISVRRIVGTEVRDSQNVRLGTIRDVLVSTEGHASAVLVSRPGLRNLTVRYRVPWDALEFDGPVGALTAAIRAADLGELRWRADTGATALETVRARHMIRSKVVLQTGWRYGRVRDVIFDLAGVLQGLVIVPAPMPGDRRGDREPHLYNETFSIDVQRRRVVLPHDRGGVPRANPQRPVRGARLDEKMNSAHTGLTYGGAPMAAL
jgi:sporulation protein YlmC with PRC-barrel domain